MSKYNLENLLKFVEFLHEVQKVNRAEFALGENRRVNDAEHSFQLALICWHIYETEKLDLDLNKIFKYCLSHDLVEVFAGDTFIFDQEGHNSKDNRENAALNEIKNQFPEFFDLHQAIEEYKRKDTEEAIFVYEVDKLVDPLSTILDNGRILKERDISYEDLFENKKQKIKNNETAKVIFKNIFKRLEKEKEKLFPK